MSSIQELKQRLKSVTSTQQLTRAMKTVAVSKYNRAQNARTAFLPYADGCRRLLADVGGFADGTPPTEDARVCYVAFTANRGLCGSYNLDLVRHLNTLIQAETRPFDVAVCGKWGADYAQRGEITQLVRTFQVGDTPAYPDAQVLSHWLTDQYEAGIYGEIVLVYSQFRNILSQVPVNVRFLPVETQPDAVPAGDVLYFPSRESLQAELYRRCLDAQIYEVMLTAASGAHGAMLMAMRTASDNSTEIRAQLERELNHLRQTEVTTEVLELASGLNDTTN